jgi:RimJ/RimL family protein N-acetyltransferase
VIAVWMPVTVVPTSAATVEIDTFITELSSIMRNCPDARVNRTRLDPAAAAFVPTPVAMTAGCYRADGAAPSGSVAAMDDVEATLTSERLVLTPLTLADAEEMVNVLADPALGAFTGDEPPSLAELRRRYAILETRHEPRGDALWLNWIVRTRGRPIGYVQATVRGPEAFLAWLIAVPHQGRGFATEATRAVVAWLVRDLGVTELRATIHDDHDASRGVARGIGLRPTERWMDGERVWATTATD